MKMQFSLGPQDAKLSFAYSSENTFREINPFGEELPSTFEPCHDKPVFGVSDQVRLKPACAATEDRQRLAQADLRLCCSHMAKQVFS